MARVTFVKNTIEWLMQGLSRQQRRIIGLLYANTFVWTMVWTTGEVDREVYEAGVMAPSICVVIDGLLLWTAEMRERFGF